VEVRWRREGCTFRVEEPPPESPGGVKEYVQPPWMVHTWVGKTASPPGVKGFHIFLQLKKKGNAAHVDRRGEDAVAREEAEGVSHGAARVHLDQHLGVYIGIYIGAIVKENGKLFSASRQAASFGYGEW
jgi:hypothetical protein